MADILHFRACLQCLFEEWIDNFILDHRAAATDCRERGRYGFQYVSSSHYLLPKSLFLILTSSSWCPTRLERYLALALLPRNPQWSRSNPDLRYPNRRASHLHESLCNGRKNAVLEWVSGLGRVGGDCGRGFVRGEVPP